MSEDAPLSENIKSYHEAIQEEFATLASGTSNEKAKVARENISMLLPDATSSLAEILHTGTKDDNVRLQAIKLVFEYTLGKPNTGNVKEDDIDRIIESLMPSKT